MAPPTWVASVGPCLVAGALAICAALVVSFGGESAQQGVFAQLPVMLDIRSALCWVLMLLCAVLMQSATNALNDYQDFVSGLDTAETVLDKSDASLVYNQIDPKNAKTLAAVLLALAAVLGVVVVVLTNWTVLIWGLISAAVVVLYSFGPRPISSLPIGELVSGAVMGGVLTCITFYATTLQFSALVVAVALITFVGVAQIMQTNNTCDIERDLSVGRRTLPGLIGSQRSRLLNGSLGVLSFLWLALVLVWAGLYWGVIVAALGFALTLPKINRLLRGPYDLGNRRVMMQTVVSYNKWLQATVALALLVGGILFHG